MDSLTLNIELFNLLNPKGSLFHEDEPADLQSVFRL